MIQISMSEAKTNLSKIVYLLELGQEEKVIITKNRKPFLEVKLASQKNFKLDIAKELIDIPDNFDDIDISNDFEE